MAAMLARGHIVVLLWFGCGGHSTKVINIIEAGQALPHQLSGDDAGNEWLPI